ncbi:metallophosphoesterase [Elioraea rosea]|uniref:metallophosphoesterase n=1 Tax=Elioraea rosea TaxID=2492390 RepID=UPI00194FA1A8|nr:metallophosphoesterase [Elioraea rosea]
MTTLRTQGIRAARRVRRARPGAPAVRMPTRRKLMRGLAAVGVSLFAGASKAFGIEPAFRLAVVPYRVPMVGWQGAPLRIAVLADLHACEPFMPPERVAEIVARTNALAPDLIVLPGDFAPGLRRIRPEEGRPEVWAAELARLRAPLGAHAVLGNHDWWEAGGPGPIRAALRWAGVRVYQNEAEPLHHGGQRFWLAGTDSAMARPLGGGRYAGADDLPRTLRAVTDDAPVILMAHEPELFRRVPCRVGLTISGHTHGGQVRIPVLGGPVAHLPEAGRYAHGHVTDRGRHLVVSGGLGFSVLPVRFGVPPEISLIEVTGTGAATA